MIKYSQIKKIFSALEFPLEEYNIETNEDIPLPFAVYAGVDFNAYGADGINYLSLTTVRIVLVDGDVDRNTQKQIEDILHTNNLAFEKNTEFDEENRIYTTTYEFGVIDD